MKKFLSIIGVSAMLSASAFAFSVTYLLPPNAATNTVSGPALVTSVAVTANTTNVAIAAVDSTTNTLVITNASYTSTYQSATNYITTWTNYFGNTNSFTNVALITITNTVAAGTNNLPTRFSLGALASTTAQINPANYTFLSGILLTNGTTGTATVTINYDK